MYRKQEAAQSVKQARHQRWLDQYSTLPMCETMTNRQVALAAVSIAAFVLACFALLHGAAVFVKVVM